MSRTTSQVIQTNILHKSKLQKFWHKNKIAYLFLLPWLLGIFVFALYPIMSSLYLSFTNYDLFQSPDWVGAQNYIHMVTQNQRFEKAILVTLRYVLIGVPLQLTTALILALILNKGIPGLPLFRALFYVPSLLGGSVAIAVLWRQLFGAKGLFNELLIMLNIVNPDKVISWVTNPSYSLYTLIILLMWAFGSPMIIFLAGLKQIPTELYEAAEIDGATKRKQFFHITFPLLTPIIFFNLVMQIISSFQAFTPAYIVGGGTSGGSLDSILFYTLHLYFVAFVEFRMGYASAMAWILLLFIVIFTGILFLSARKWVYYEQ